MHVLDVLAMVYTWDCLVKDCGDQRPDSVSTRMSRPVYCSEGSIRDPHNMWASVFTLPSRVWVTSLVKLD